MSKIIYISYDGMLEPLGQSQVLRYLERLVVKNDIWLISFEKPGDWSKINERELLKKNIKNSGIRWIPLKYHKRPSALATAFDIFQGVLVSAFVVVLHRVEIIHARSYVPSVMALVLKKMFGAKFVFDMRGFWADERIDGGMWLRNSRLYRVAKWFERRFLLSADCIVSLSQAAVVEMSNWDYLRGLSTRFRVITTCADLEIFSPQPVFVVKKPFMVGYVGTASGWYLFDETLRCFLILKEKIPDARLHIVNRGEHEFIQHRLLHHGIPLESVILESANHAGVAQAMQHMDATIFFIKPVFSKIASAPTKLGEFLGCGVPCMGNSGVGDMAAILEKARVGVAINKFDHETLCRGVTELLALCAEPGIRERCVVAAHQYFSVDLGVKGYAQIYQELTGSSRKGADLC